MQTKAPAIFFHPRFTGKLCIFVLCCLWLSACSTVPQSSNTRSDSVTAPKRTDTPASLLRRAESAPADTAALYRFQAATLLADSGELESALDTIALIAPPPQEATLQADIALLQAGIQEQLQRPRDVLNSLGTDKFPPLRQINPSQQIEFHQLRARAQYDIAAMLTSALERIQLDRLLPEQSKPQNHELIWQALNTIPLSQLQALAATAINYEVRGWYELALIARSNSTDLDRQLVEVRRWRDGWIRHPAYASLPSEMALVEQMARDRPNQVALLLPLSSPAGQIVRDAFMSAYFNLLELGGQVPVVRLYDTSQTNDILALHQQARNEGAQMIIGPLLKEHVATLQQAPDLEIPTLALNNVEGVAPLSSLLYQFALSPEDEARQTAHRAWRDGHRKAAILNPAGDFRKRDSFISEWQLLGGQIVALESFQDNYTQTISALLELDASNQRHEKLNKLINRTTVFQPRRRQDIGILYLIAQSAPARQIVPSLSYLYAGDIPVYASQDVYTGVPRPIEDRDLNGVSFAESPWVLQLDDSSVSRARELFPQTSAQALRLQAFGLDAFRLYPRLSLLANNANIQIPGASGLLKLGPNQNIIRQLTWAEIQDGLIKTSE